MVADQSYTLLKLIRSYGLQMDYLQLLVDLGRLDPDEAKAEIDLFLTKMDFAVERFCQLGLEQEVYGQPDGRAIDPSLIPDMQFI